MTLPQTRDEVIYKLKNKGYTYKILGDMFDVTKQRAYEMYWQYWKRNREIDSTTCDLCEEQNDTVKWRKEYKLCQTCWEHIRHLKKNKYKSIAVVTSEEKK